MHELVLAAEDFAVVDAAAANPRPGKDADQAARRAAGAEAIFTVYAGVDVVENHGRASKFFFERRLDLDVFPAEVGSVEDHAFVEIERARTPQADAANGRAIEIGFGQRVVNRLNDAGEAGLGPFVPLRLAPFADDGAERGIVDQGHHLRAAQVEADPAFVFLRCVHATVFACHPCSLPGTGIWAATPSTDRTGLCGLSVVLRFQPPRDSTYAFTGSYRGRRPDDSSRGLRTGVRGRPTRVLHNWGAGAISGSEIMRAESGLVSRRPIVGLR